MIYTDTNRLKITQKGNNYPKDFTALLSKYLIQPTSKTPLNFHTSNFENDSFVVDWQLSMDENFEADKHLF